MDEQNPAVSMGTSPFFRKAYHNLRNPIVVIKGYAALMLEGCGGELSGDLQEWVSDMKRNSDHLLDLINALAELSCLEAGIKDEKTGDLHLQSILRDLVDSFSQLAEGKKLQVTMILPGSEQPFRGDELLVTKAFRALVHNAFLYTPGEGAVEISLEDSPGEVSLKVKDNGPGIEHPSQVFEGFYRGELPVGTDFKGTGLGLLMARTIAGIYGGSLSLESSPGGSLFTLTLKR